MEKDKQEVPDDTTIKGAIQKAVSHLEKPIRPNKLRKIVCNQVKGCNWTQYQQLLDYMIKEEKSICTCMINDEEMISPLNEVNSNSHYDDSNAYNNKELSVMSIDDDNSNNNRGAFSPSLLGSNTNNTHSIICTTFKVPLAIIYHLTKKGQKKQKSLEENTKTKFTFSNESLIAVKKKEVDFNTRCSFTISSLKEDVEETSAKKHIKTAKLLLSKMVKSFQMNPDHFIPRKAGGTFKEQEEAKKRKLEAKQKNISKKRDNEDNENGHIHTEIQTLKKKRKKFY